MATGWRLLALAVAALIGLGPVPARAGPATDRVKAAVDRVTEIVPDPELTEPANTEKRRARIRGVARTLFDLLALAQRSRGRHWAQRTPEQRKQFVELYADLLENSYVSKIEAYGGEKVVYEPEKVDGDLVEVRSKVLSQRGTEIPIEYRLRRDGDPWEVVDVEIEGVSLVLNYRSQFSASSRDRRTRTWSTG